MMASMLSRFLPNAPAGRSIYEDLKAHDDASSSDLEERAGLNLDEENLRYRDDQLGDAADFYGEESHITTRSTISGKDAPLPGIHTRDKGKGKTPDDPMNWEAESPRLLEEDLDDDVPASLLIEDHFQLTPNDHERVDRKTKSPPAPVNDEARDRANYQSPRTHVRSRSDPQAKVPPVIVHNQARISSGTPKDRAMWRWANVTNLDNFMSEVYGYYTGAGVWCIVLDRIIELLKLIFVAFFTTFLTQCIAWSRIPHSSNLKQVMVEQCTKKISGMPNVAIWLLTLFVFYRSYQLLVDLPRLMRLHDFFHHLLEVPDGDMQTISWQEVVARIMALRDANPITMQKISPANRKWVLGSQSKERLDAHDICNRLMRKENYLIALFNKEILDLTLPLPFLQGRQLFSRTLEWNLQWCILDFIFNESGQVRQLVLKDHKRRDLSNGLRDRFLFAGFMNVICAPVIVIYLMIVYFLRYFNEYYKNPSALGSRSYTPLAEWKFREFNELHHLFQQRINMSYPFASRYLEQFPRMKTVQATRFVAFVAGAIVSVLVVATIWDPEVFLGFEITPERTALFYLGVFGPLWAIMNGSIPDDNLVFDPEYALHNVIEYTHYQPAHWAERLHSNEVKSEFATLYKLKILIFLEEILSIIITPFLLWFSLPKCSDAIIDFFREFTVHVDGVGYVCSFAVFDFKNGVGRRGGRPEHATQSPGGDPRENYYSTKHGKMAASYYGFLDNYMLNPKTGVPGHQPPGSRHHVPHFNPPPNFPSMMSPTQGPETRGSRNLPNDRRSSNRSTILNAPSSMRAPRFPPVSLSSPMPSILLDPHHQPSSSGFGVRSMRRNSRSRRPTRTDIVEEDGEVEDDPMRQTLSRRKSIRMAAADSPYESAVGLGESRWETSPTRVLAQDEREAQIDDDSSGGKGVLGLLYQFQKAKTDGRPGVNI